MNTPKKDCGRSDCRYSLEAQYQTLVHNPVVGGPDLNTVTGRMSCLSCKKRWVFVQNYQGTQFTELKLDAAND